MPSNYKRFYHALFKICRPSSVSLHSTLAHHSSPFTYSPVRHPSFGALPHQFVLLDPIKFLCDAIKGFDDLTSDIKSGKVIVLLRQETNIEKDNEKNINILLRRKDILKVITRYIVYTDEHNI